MKQFFKAYDEPFPAGVKLPVIKIEKKYYDLLGCSPEINNFLFLRKLCFKGVQDKGIDTLPNKKDYLTTLLQRRAHRSYSAAGRDTDNSQTLRTPEVTSPWSRQKLGAVCCV